MISMKLKNDENEERRAERGEECDLYIHSSGKSVNNLAREQERSKQ
jgi:hypothetical protein